MELVILRDEKEVGRLRLSEGTFSIGRGLHNTIALDDQSISRRHARIRVEAESVIVQDLCSANGTFLRGKPITQSNLEDGDLLEVGPFKICILFTDDDFVDHQLEGTARVSIQELEREEAGEDWDNDDAGERTFVGRLPGNEADADEAADASAATWPEGGFVIGWPVEEEEPEWGASAREWDSQQETSEQAEQSRAVARDEEMASPVEGMSKSGSEESSLNRGESQLAAEGEEYHAAPAEDEEYEELQDEDLSGVISDELEAQASEELDLAQELELSSDSAPRLPNTLNLAESPSVSGLRQANRSAISREEPLSDESAPRLELRGGLAVRSRFELARGTAFIGRAEEMEIVLLDLNASRRHAAVFWEEDGYILRDLWSLNGLLVNGERVTAARLHSGDMIQIGDTLLEFVWPGDPALDESLAPTDVDQVRGATQQDVVEEAEPEIPVSDAAAVAEPEPPSPEVGVSPSAEAAIPLTKAAVPLPNKEAKTGNGKASGMGWWTPLGVALLLVASIVAISRVMNVVPESSPDTTTFAHQGRETRPLSTEAARYLTKSQLLLEEKEFDAALQTASAVQAMAPDSPVVRRQIQRIYESRVVDRIGSSLEVHQLLLAEKLAGAEESADIEVLAGGEEPASSPTPRAATSTETVFIALASPEVPRKAVTARKTRGTPQKARPNAVRKTPVPAPTPVAMKLETGDKVRSDLDTRVARYYRQGENARNAKRYLDAIRSFERALAEDPYKESALYYQIEDQIQALKSELEEQTRPLVVEAIALIDQERYVEARKLLKRATLQAPDYPLAVNRLRELDLRLERLARTEMARARDFERSGMDKQAVARYRKVLAMVPEKSAPLHREAATRLGVLLP